MRLAQQSARSLQLNTILLTGSTEDGDVHIVGTRRGEGTTAERLASSRKGEHDSEQGKSLHKEGRVGQVTGSVQLLLSIVDSTIHLLLT